MFPDVESIEEAKIVFFIGSTKTHPLGLLI